MTLRLVTLSGPPGKLVVGRFLSLELERLSDNQSLNDHSDRNDRNDHKMIFPAPLILLWGSW